ncbi:hypothetical protein AVEN_202285-1 [Araneus ventricosus]|uniref:Uncharacterized protein n=1 Tax=Araneus ventricosus TaxID=182803 RepID=A0A4Y2GPE3_ARAVE|nr:hypothetical protein AVEN_202285-1 [Araneus ventricosus]
MERIAPKAVINAKMNLLFYFRSLSIWSFGHKSEMRPWGGGARLSYKSENQNINPQDRDNRSGAMSTLKAEGRSKRSVPRVSEWPFAWSLCDTHLNGWAENWNGVECFTVFGLELSHHECSALNVTTNMEGRIVQYKNRIVDG